MEKLQDEIETYLATLTIDKIGSKRLKALMGKSTVAPRTWATVIQRVSAQCIAPKKDSIRECTVGWKLVGQSLIRVTAESFGFCADKPAA